MNIDLLLPAIFFGLSVSGILFLVSFGISIGDTLWSPLAFVAPFIVMFCVILWRFSGLFDVAGKAFGFQE